MLEARDYSVALQEKRAEELVLGIARCFNELQIERGICKHVGADVDPMHQVSGALHDGSLSNGPVELQI